MPFNTHSIHGTGIFTNIYHNNQPNIGKYTVRPLDAMGYHEWSMDPKKNVPRKKKHQKRRSKPGNSATLWPFWDGEKVTLYKWLLVTNPTFGDQVRSRLVWITWCSCLPSRKHRPCRWTKRWTEPPEIVLKTLPARPVDGNGEGKCHKWREADFFPSWKKGVLLGSTLPPTNSQHHDDIAFYAFFKVWESQPKPSFATVTGVGGKFQCIVNSCFFSLTTSLTWHSCNDWWNVTFNRQVSLLSFSGGSNLVFLKCCVALIMIDKPVTLSQSHAGAFIQRHLVEVEQWWQRAGERLKTRLLGRFCWDLYVFKFFKKRTAIFTCRELRCSFFFSN